MAVMRSMALLVLVLFMFGCPEPKAPTSSPEAVVSDDSVYGDGQSTAENSATEVVEEETPIYDSEEITTERLITNPGHTASVDPKELNWSAVLFDFDKANLTEQAKQSLREYSRVLLDHGDLKVLLEGHCDTRGTEEYNLALGERRAQQVKRYLLELGVHTNQLRTISYGELRPSDLEEGEQGWAINRRVSFTF